MPKVMSLILLILAAGVGLSPSSVPDPAAADDAAMMILSARDTGTRFASELEYALARERMLAYLKEGDKVRALEAAKMHFLFCPIAPDSLSSASASVKLALIAFDGNDKRARRFEAFAFQGPAGGDGKVGTADDLGNPLADVSVGHFSKDKSFYVESDRTLDERGAVSSMGDKGWYATEKAFIHLNGGDMDGALDILITTLAECIKVPHGMNNDDWELQRRQDVIDRLNVGLTVIYRARTGTVAGVWEFVQRCDDFAQYGVAGKDGRIGTEDDLACPI